MFLGFDPGRDKCGIAVVSEDAVVQYQAVVPSEEAIATVQSLCQQFQPRVIVMGDQTTSKQWKAKLASLVEDAQPDSGQDSEHPSGENSAPRLGPMPQAIAMVDERYSTLEARQRYWVLYPPTGMARLVPQSLRSIPRPIDDIVAILLVERYLAHLEQAHHA